jgi:hypothetical protein
MTTTTETNEFTASDAINILAGKAQWCRENGEPDMRYIINTASLLRRMISEGKSREEIIEAFHDDEED